ncbi:MAG: hypothetical protein DMG99_12955 [Acidobacteria bacterium]|nr:MAG: hypothetical protein DMG99_12955 [Acidobacteriota bacterium]
MKPRTDLPAGVIKNLLFLTLLMIGSTAVAQSDNRYCRPGDTPDFGSSNDGPAALPNRCINTALSSSPSPGKQIKVSDPKGVTAALQSASCGDTLVLSAGQTFAPFNLPAKPCDAAHWITIRTSAESELPPEGTRLTPCYAGSASLPARPTYNCPTPTNSMARIELKVGAGAISVAPGANHYRIIGLEVTRTAGTGTVYALIRFEGSADHVVIDRSWIHGTPLDESVRGINLGGSSYVGIVDSYFNDFHCIAVTGACVDAQAIVGGNSKVPVGVYKIVNNYLEAAAENVLFGGAPGSQIPADIEVRRNHLFKPLSWQPGRPDFVGKKFIVKNLFELKNAERVLVEGNVMENSWGGYSQVGYAILLTPRGAWAAVQDVTIRKNLIRHSGSGMQLAASLSDGSKEDSLAAQRWSIHDDLLEDIDADAYNGDGMVFQISSGFSKNVPLNNVRVSHVTVATRGRVKSLILVGAAPDNPRLPFAISFNDNIVPAGTNSVWSSGRGTCPKSGQPATTFKNCWSSFEVKNNVIIDYAGGQGAWPQGNFLVKDVNAVGFERINNDEPDYRLSSTSHFAGKASDGRNAGADMDAVRAAIEGVR